MNDLLRDYARWNNVERAAVAVAAALGAALLLVVALIPSAFSTSNIARAVGTSVSTSLRRTNANGGSVARPDAQRARSRTVRNS
jgi:hypothetical protein